MRKNNVLRKKIITQTLFLKKNLSVRFFCLLLHPQTRNNGTIAQLVEQRTENPCVPGSIPGGTTEESQRNLTLFFL